MPWPIPPPIDHVYDVGEEPPRDSLDTDYYARRFGRDLRFRGDFEVGSDGDLVRTVKLEGLTASFERAIITARGEIDWRPDYGIGATELLNLPGTVENVQTLKNRIVTTLLQHEAVEEVSTIDVVMRSTGLVEVHTLARIDGQSQRFVLQPPTRGGS